ncbi:MAG: SDR family NAD(P)-dependent oxidoreductase [Candidatus Binataceae bacterium]
MSAFAALPRAFVGNYFRGRTALITGASSGIGRDLALTLAALGAKVGILARRRQLLDELAGEINAATDTPALVLAADVTKRDHARSAVDRALDHFGHLDILINSAGIMEPGPVESMDAASLERMMSVNLFGVLHMMQAVMPSMRAAHSGNIVNIASLAGRRGMPPLGGYCASKFAVVGLTEALRVELYGSGVRVALVMPGVINTPMTQGAAGVDALAGIPEQFYAMPVQWVTWATIAAIVLGLTEVDVPPGAAVAEKIAALFPGLTDSALAMGRRFMEWSGRRPKPD